MPARHDPTGSPSRPRLRARCVSVLGLLGGLLVASGCAATPDPEPAVYGAPEILAALQPGDIAVPPLQNLTGHPSIPIEGMRASFSRALVERLYSPLDAEYVDGNWVEASFRGTPAPDAVLVISILRWDENKLFEDGTIAAAAELVLFQGGSTTGNLLWGRSVDLTIDMKDGRAAAPGPSPNLIPDATLAFARQALSTLPERDPVAAHP